LVCKIQFFNVDTRGIYSYPWGFQSTKNSVILNTPETTYYFSYVLSLTGYHVLCEIRIVDFCSF